MRVQHIVTICAASAAAASLPGEQDWTNYKYMQYVTDFKKSLDSSENVDRESVFESNLAIINKQNADTTKTWFATVNEFSDWTNEEFRQRRAHGTSSHMTLSEAPVQEYAPAPASVDWRNTPGVVTKVKNQGGCGSCWAFSATETIESALAIATNQTAPELSPQQIVDCAPNPKKCGGTGGCDGATQEVAFDYLSTVGLTTEANYRYTEATGTCHKDKIKPVAANSGFVKLPANNYTALINAVANIGPIAISVAAGGNGWQVYGGGVYADACGYEQDHAVQLVGYGTEKGQGYYIVRNSWGSGWGEDGYIRIARYGEGKEPCGMDSKPQDGSACAGDTKPVKLCGLCGILSDSSYPTGVKQVGPSPAPGPAPGPSPFPAACKAAMTSSCGNTKGAGPSICRGCCSAHESDLKSAGCTPGDWDSWCEPSIVV